MGEPQSGHGSAYRWLPARSVLAFVLYWLVATIGAGAIVRLGGTASTASGWTIFVMLGFVILCMVTERGRFPIWGRIGFPVLAWVAHAFLTVPAYLLAIMVSPELVDRAANFIASIPVVIVAMRQSSWFVSSRESP